MGLPIISIATGSQIGMVKDVVFFPTSKKISALIVNVKKLISSSKAIRIEDVVQVGKSAVLVADEKCMFSIDKLPKSPLIKSYQEELLDTQVYTDSGINLGVVQDISFDFELGMLEEIEISDGIVQDLMDGRKIIPVTESMQLEKGIVIIESKNVHQLKNNGKGLRKLWKRSNKNEKK
jgi:uncharacterized protein YrrD